MAATKIGTFWVVGGATLGHPKSSKFELLNFLFFSIIKIKLNQKFKSSKVQILNFWGVCWLIQAIAGQAFKPFRPFRASLSRHMFIPPLACMWGGPPLSLQPSFHSCLQHSTPPSSIAATFNTFSPVPVSTALQAYCRPGFQAMFHWLFTGQPEWQRQP